MINFTKSSGLIAASAIVSRYPCLLTDFIVITDGTNPATIIIYDSLDNSGTVLAKYALAGASLAKEIIFAVPVQAKIGLYVAVSGTGANVLIHSTPE